MERSTVFQGERAITVQTDFIRRVYNWMALGLAVTAITALYAVNSGLIFSLLRNPMVMLVLIVGELGLVIALSAAIGKVPVLNRPVHVLRLFVSKRPDIIDHFPRLHKSINRKYLLHNRRNFRRYERLWIHNQTRPDFHGQFPHDGSHRHNNRLLR